MKPAIVDVPVGAPDRGRALPGVAETPPVVAPRRGRPEMGDPLDVLAGQQEGESRGRRITKVVVPPAECASSVPPCESTISWAM